MDDLNHANRSPCLRAGQSRRPISNNGFHRHRTKLGNTYCRGAGGRNYNCSRPPIRYSSIFAESTLNRKLKEPASRLPERKNVGNRLYARIRITPRRLRVRVIRRLLAREARRKRRVAAPKEPSVHETNLLFLSDFPASFFRDAARCRSVIP